MIKFTQAQVDEVNPDKTYNIKQVQAITGANYWTVGRWGNSGDLKKIPICDYPDDLTTSEKLITRFLGTSLIAFMGTRLIRG
ncbi:MAG: hypothetical protein KAT00_15235 [Planctomycetes bacterium]|nr:hypothetical protein [Planctomycetota bacterium]